MVKYFVKRHCEATEAVGVACNRIQDYYYGKPLLVGGPICSNHEPTSFEGTLYGLDTLEEAEELMATMQPKADAETAAGSWVVSLSIVEA